MVKCALISVSDKRDLESFAKGLVEVGVKILASAGTAKFLKENGISVEGISDYTGYPEILGGRVKTLHPKIYGGILAKDEHLKELKKHKIELIDLVVVNLYPFEEKSASLSVEDAMEYVDIGGEALIRAAAKNHQRVGVVVDAADYERVLEEMRSGGLTQKTRLYLAEKAFNHVARYNVVIAEYLRSQDQNELPSHLNISFPQVLRLRYGENPHQMAAFYSHKALKQLHGKELSYNNILDLDASLAVFDFKGPTAVIIKHTNPCGLASANTIEQAFEMALKTDEKSAFGGIVGLNRSLTEGVAKAITDRFFEAVLAPSCDEDALKILQKKKGLIVIEFHPQGQAYMLRGTQFGLLLQTQDVGEVTEADLKIATKIKPSSEQIKELIFAWKAVRYVKSNAIVLVKDERTVGIGAGQMSRVDAVELAIKKAGEHAKGSVLASDAFFPFRDSIDIASAAGVGAIIQPGGSIRDREVIEAAEEHKIPMVFTGKRQFRH